VQTLLSTSAFLGLLDEGSTRGAPCAVLNDSDQADWLRAGSSVVDFRCLTPDRRRSSNCGIRAILQEKVAGALPHSAPSRMVVGCEGRRRAVVTLDEAERAILECLVERIFPTDEHGPGGRKSARLTISSYGCSAWKPGPRRRSDRDAGARLLGAGPAGPHVCRTRRRIAGPGDRSHTGWAPGWGRCNKRVHAKNRCDDHPRCVLRPAPWRQQEPLRVADAAGNAAPACQAPMTADSTIEADVALVGVGAAGGIAAYVLCSMGLSVEAIEAGPFLRSQNFQQDDSDLGPKFNSELPMRERGREAPRLATPSPIGLMVNAVGGSRTPASTLCSASSNASQGLVCCSTHRSTSTTSRSYARLRTHFVPSSPPAWTCSSSATGC
jgi:hypothetical protein